MKNEVLRLLKENKGFVSGEEISEILGVTRTMVWKYITALKQEGYIIEAYSKKGYRLVESPDILTGQEVLPVLQTDYMGRELVHFDSTGSTNVEARKRALEGCAEGLVVITEEQTEGKGRLGRRWVTPKSSAIAFSIVLRPHIKPEDAPKITLVMGLAVCKAIANIPSMKPKIKWPNDIIVNNKKVCGILTEMNAEMDAVNYIIIGTGVNVNIKQFPEELKDMATSLYLESGSSLSRREILSSILMEFEKLYDEFKKNGLGGMISEFKTYSVTLGRRVRVLSVNESFEGEAFDIAEDGILQVRLDDGSVRNIISGDVSVRGINGYV